jgi:hypothetical protein
LDVIISKGYYWPGGRELWGLCHKGYQWSDYNPMMIKAKEDPKIEVRDNCEAKGISSKVVQMWLWCWSTREMSSWKHLLDSKERGIKTSEFFQRRKASSSTFSARRTSLDNVRIGESLFILFITVQ